LAATGGDRASERWRKKDTITVANELSLATGITEWIL
jgi:hypothetical protein